MGDNQSRLSPGISPLERRAIEISVAAAFHHAATEVAGPDTADAIFAKAVGSLADDAAADLAGGEALSLGDLWAVWQNLGGDGRLDLHLDALEDGVLQFHVDRCAYAELYREMDLADLGVAFSCRRDKPFAEALVPGVKVEQSRTILEGASRCEFTYTLEDR